MTAVLLGQRYKIHARTCTCRMTSDLLWYHKSAEYIVLLMLLCWHTIHVTYLGLLHAHDKSYKVETQLVKQGGGGAERVGRGRGVTYATVCLRDKKKTHKQTATQKLRYIHVQKPCRRRVIINFFTLSDWPPSLMYVTVAPSRIKRVQLRQSNATWCRWRGNGSSIQQVTHTQAAAGDCMCEGLPRPCVQRRLCTNDYHGNASGL